MCNVNIPVSKFCYLVFTLILLVLHPKQQPMEVALLKEHPSRKDNFLNKSFLGKVLRRLESMNCFRYLQ